MPQNLTRGRERQGRRVNQAPDLLTEWARLAPNRQALVLGAGGGWEASWLAAAGFQVDAVERDTARAAALAGQTAGTAVRVHAEDARTFTILPARFGLVAALAVLHFIPPGELSELARQMAAGLAPGGVLIAQVLVRDAGRERTAGGNGAHLFERGELKGLFPGLEPLLDETYRFADPRRTSGFGTGAALVARRPAPDRG